MKGFVFSAKWLKFLTWPGLACTTAGLVAAGLSGWQLLPTTLLILGIGLILLGLSFSGKTAGAFWQQRSTQVGTNAVVATIAVLTILGLVNFLSVQNAARYDLTETQLFTLAPASQTIVRSLEQPVRIIIFDSMQNPQDVQLLESYRRESSNFSFEYIDPFANPTVAQSFGATQTGMVFLEVGDDRRFLQTIGATANPENLGTSEPLSERELTNALDQVVSDRTLTVYFMQGHGEPPIDGSEPGFTQAVESLQDKNYQVQPLNLAETQTVPDDADVVVVAGPAQEFFAAEVRALETYVIEGGGLMLMLDPRSDAGLSTLLDDWGVILDDRLVLDTSGAGQFVGLGPAAPIVTNYGDHPITQEFESGRSFFPLARPVESRELPNTTATPLLFTDAQSRAEAISDDGNLSFDPNAPPEGPYILGVALSRPAEEVPEETVESIPESDIPIEAETAPPIDTAAEADTAAETEAAVGSETSDEAIPETPSAEEQIADATVDPDSPEESDVDAAVNGESDAAVIDAEPLEDSAAPEDATIEDTPSSVEDTVAPESPEGDETETDVTAEDLLAEPETAQPGTAQPEVEPETVESEVPATDAETDNASPTEARLVVIGNSSFAVDGSFNQQLNGDVFLNSVNWLGQEADATLSIRPKTVTDRRLAITGQQAWGLGIFSLLVLPLTGLALAILMALRRR